MKKRVIIIFLLLILISLAVLCICLSTLVYKNSTDNKEIAEAIYTFEVTTPSPEPTVEPTPAPTPEPTIDPNARIIYLTFDDGPDQYTQRLLDILDEYGIKVTFFVTANHSDYTYLITEEYNRGHAIGIHAYNHTLSTVYDDYISDFNKMRELIKNLTDEEVKIFRFPGGSSNTISYGKMQQLVNELEAGSFVYFDWDVDSGDAVYAKSKESVLNNLKQGVLQSQKYSVCLCHDVYDYTVDAIEEFVPWALENGFVFAKLTTEGPVVHHMIK